MFSKRGDYFPGEMSRERKSVTTAMPRSSLKPLRGPAAMVQRRAGKGTRESDFWGSEVGFVTIRHTSTSVGKHARRISACCRHIRPEGVYAFSRAEGTAANFSWPHHSSEAQQTAPQPKTPTPRGVTSVEMAMTVSVALNVSSNFKKSIFFVVHVCDLYMFFRDLYMFAICSTHARLYSLKCNRQLAEPVTKPAALRWAAAAELATWLPGGTPLGCSWSAGRWVAARQSRRTPVAVPTTRSLRKEREPQATSSCALPAAVRTAATSSARALELADR